MDLEGVDNDVITVNYVSLDIVDERVHVRWARRAAEVPVFLRILAWLEDVTSW